MSKSGDLFSKFGEAVRRRMYPNTHIHPKQMANIAGVSLNTFMRWYRGESRIPLDATYNLAHFFARTGDAMFLAEVCGPEVVPINRYPATEVAAAVVDILKAKGVAA